MPYKDPEKKKQQMEEVAQARHKRGLRPLALPTAQAPLR